MKKLKRNCAALLVGILLVTPRAWGDFWGGDIPLLIEIVANTAQQLIKLESIIGTGVDTLNYIQDINSGIREALRIARTMNTTLSPGILSQISTIEGLSHALENFYGRVPVGADSSRQKLMDQSVAEAVHLHNEAFRYAQTIDPEAEKIKDYARVVSPQGAERLTAQSLGVLITVLNQVLRTNAAMLKLQSEQLALSNRHEKLNSEQFNTQYNGLSKAFTELKSNSNYSLPSLGSQ